MWSESYRDAYPPTCPAAPLARQGVAPAQGLAGTGLWATLDTCSAWVCSCSFSQWHNSFSDTPPDRVLSHGTAPASSPRTVRGKLMGRFAQAVHFSGGTARGIQTCPLLRRALRRAKRWTCLLCLGVSHWRVSTCFHCVHNREMVFCFFIIIIYKSSCRFPLS